MMDKFVAEHTNALARIAVGVFLVWFFGGLALVDALNPIIFIVIWIPIGLLGALFAARW